MSGAPGGCSGCAELIDSGGEMLSLTCLAPNNTFEILYLGIYFHCFIPLLLALFASDGGNVMVMTCFLVSTRIRRCQSLLPLGFAFAKPQSKELLADEWIRKHKGKQILSSVVVVVPFCCITPYSTVDILVFSFTRFQRTHVWLCNYYLMLLHSNCSSFKVRSGLKRDKASFFPPQHFSFPQISSGESFICQTDNCN